MPPCTDTYISPSRKETQVLTPWTPTLHQLRCHPALLLNVICLYCGFFSCLFFASLFPDCFFSLSLYIIFHVLGCLPAFDCSLMNVNEIN